MAKRSEPPVDQEPAELPKDPAPLSWQERHFHPRRLIGAATVATLAVTIPWVYRQLPELQTRSEYRLPFSQIHLEPPLPADVPPYLLEQVREKAGIDEQISLLDSELPRRLAEAFSHHPWIEQVVSVRNVYPSLVTVEVRYRKAVALVEVTDGFYAVDAGGVLLPPGDFQPADADRLLLVTGILSKPQGSAGRNWGDPIVTGAAQLAEFLAARRQDLSLSAIQVVPPETTTVGRIEYRLLTKGGSTILWGRAPGSNEPGELAPHQKLGRLEKYLTEFGSFERPQGPYEIDIRHWQEISRRPLRDPYSHTARRREAGQLQR